MEPKDCKRVLGMPYFESERCLLFNAECVQSMIELACVYPESIDLCVTSPPYNIGKEYEHRLTVEEYLAWSQRWITSLDKLIRPHGAFWLNLGYFALDQRARAIPISYLLWDRIPFFLMQEVVWHYGAGVAAKAMLSPRNEKFLWYVKNSENYTFNLDAIRDPDVKYPNQKKHGRLKCNPLGKNPTDVWSFPKVTSGEQRSSKERTPHPAQFPVRVIDRIVKGFSNPDEWVIDPFIGSGTTAVAALGSGRRVIGFEVNSDYCKIASDRIQQHLREKVRQDAQKTLF